MFRIALLALILATPGAARAALVLETTQSSPGIFDISVTTDDVFDTLEVLVDGNVAIGLNIVPVSGVTGQQQFVSFTPVFTLLSPLGSPSTAGVFDPGLNGDIDLTYGVTSPVPGEWTVGLISEPILRFDLLGGVATATVNLLRGGNQVGTASKQVSLVAIPEPTMAGVFGLLGSVWFARPRRSARSSLGS